MRTRLDIAGVLRAAYPVMLGYVAIGLPCGILWGKLGIGPWWCFLMSVTFYSGAGQFMIPSLVMAATPYLSTLASVSMVSARQMLYSAALAPHARSASKPLAFLFAATVTDESFGVNIDRFEHDPSWTPAHGLACNCCCMLSWAASNAAGSALGPVIDLPIDILMFAMTSIFICLLLSQPYTPTNVVVAAVTFAGIIAAKLVGLGGAAIVIGAVAGVVAGIVFGGRIDGRTA